jgi:hypothetical protein
MVKQECNIPKERKEKILKLSELFVKVAELCEISFEDVIGLSQKIGIFWKEKYYLAQKYSPIKEVYKKYKTLHYKNVGKLLPDPLNSDFKDLEIWFKSKL